MISFTCWWIKYPHSWLGPLFRRAAVAHAFSGYYYIAEKRHERGNNLIAIHVLIIRSSHGGCIYASIENHYGRGFKDPAYVFHEFSSKVKHACGGIDQIQQETNGRYSALFFPREQIRDEYRTQCVRHKLKQGKLARHRDYHRAYLLNIRRRVCRERNFAFGKLHFIATLVKSYVLLCDARDIKLKRFFKVFF